VLLPEFVKPESRISLRNKCFRKEINKTFKMFFVRFCILVIGNVTSYVVLYVILTTYTQSGNYLTSEIAEAISAIRRMGTVVERIEREVEHTRKICEKVPGILLKDVNVFINGVNVLPEIDLNVVRGLTVKTGPVGSGKSVLMKTILQEYE
jgi:ATP-binding cassette subfamily C (CFTR/MRP) protein 4